MDELAVLVIILRILTGKTDSQIKLKRLRKVMDMDISVLSISNRRFIGGSYTEIKF